MNMDHLHSTLHSLSHKHKKKMFTPSNLKTLYPLQTFSVKSSPSSTSSNISSMKFKRIIHTLIVSHLCRIFRTLSKVKDVIVEILKDNSTTISFHQKKRNNHNIRKKIILGSFRLHYNWCSSKSSHVLPVPQPVYEGLFDTTVNSSGEDFSDDSRLAGYLQWLEEKKKNEGGEKNKKEEMNEIDMLAEKFIANCHEKFKLEKQESDRRFQEMLARSM